MDYEAQAERFLGSAAGWPAQRDSGRVTVRVVKREDGSGVPDALISLDGKELRFTDAEGLAWFDHVPRGVHVVAIEERSLPPDQRLIGVTRAFITIEDRVRIAPLVFTIARPEKRKSF